ncbi:hypothetical protein SAMN04487783_2054 [Agrococcus baldri]|uniref:UPF0182 protein SAMN04487783_2054 n=1 Tax=Agrococcus baldri TaxID=153730 RepID=A0AA94HNV3_9MICO|nr:UPF0182 family protein [Agrococcus baldri]SFS15505.1 hypothetical protein SAMN04487783_2054 [Agrococcus baldri]
MSANAERPTAATTGRQRPSPLLITVLIVAAIIGAFVLFSGFYADILWFDQLGFVQVLQTRWVSIVVMFLIGFVAMAVPLALAVQIAFRSRPVYAQLNSQLDRYQELVEPLRKLVMWAAPVALGLFSGIAAASQWETAQLWLHRRPFGETDPQFGLDVGFYIFELPFYQQIVGFALAVLFISGVATLATAYLYGAIRVTGREVRISRSARIQLAIIVALYMLALGVSIWLGQYASLAQTSQGFLPTGAGWTEVNASIPAAQILAGIAGLVAVFFIITAIIGRWRIAIVGTGLLIAASLVVGVAYPAIMQRFQVEPSERSMEQQYIQRNIDATRAAWGVDEMVETRSDARTDAEPGALRADAETTANIRILDPALVTDAFANLQEYRQYYGFQEQLDVDRYEIDGQTQDTVIAVRELDLSGLADDNWYNRHIVYTHGYGVVAAYGNQRGPEGQPVFLQEGIPTTGELGDYQPRVYFGEEMPDYSIVGGPEGAPDLELDYPLSSDEGAGNAETTFAGDGGPALDNIFNRLVYALKFQSEQIILSDAVTDDSQILYDRDPLERVAEVAPYLTLDSDTYPAVVDEQLVWIVDGMTTASTYPYSSHRSVAQAIADTTNPTPPIGDVINYVRNSVKAVVNAYDGSVTLYAWNTEDPILQAWNEIYPGTIRPISEMSGELMSHVRYPADMFKLQRSILGDYHVTNPDTFFSGDDQWATPTDPTEGSTQAAAPTQPPYYLTMSVDGQDPAFTLYSTFIPRDGRNVLYGYLSVNADAGGTAGEVADTYGQLTLQMLPKDRSIPGPGQVQNTFDTDDQVSRELNLLRQGASEVINGNLLTLPVGGGLLYVQPVYLQSTGATSYPVLRKILVSFGNDIAFEDTLDEALDALFGGDSGAEAGDSGVDPTNPDEGEGAGEGEEPAPEGSLQAQLDAAVQAAGTALQERQAAYAENDLVAAAEADERLTAALAQAIELSAQIEGETAPGETAAPEETPAPEESSAP